MELDSFVDYLHERELAPDQIKAVIKIINLFADFLPTQHKSIDQIEYEDLHNFSAYLITNSQNTFDNYVALLRFGYFKKNNQLIIATMELLDGREIIPNFSKKLIEEFGEQIRNEIFADMEVPPLGLHPKKKPEVTIKLMERFLKKIDQKKCIEFLEQGLRDKYPDSYTTPRATFLKIKNIDEFLKITHQNLINTLKTHQQDKALFYTKEVDDSVIEHVTNDQTIGAGVRDGNRVIITKIPYLTIPYLNESDDMKRRYYCCHNPWIREALLEEDHISPIICHNSAGYYKNFWEAVLDQPVKVELLESVIMGDNVCKFALHLTSETLDAIDK